MSKFLKPELLYDYNSLEPNISEQTMRLHHQTHHQACVEDLEKISSSIYSNVDLHTLIAGLNDNAELTEENKIILQNFGGGHYNHSIF